MNKDEKMKDCIEKFGTNECHCACRCLDNEFCIDADKVINKLKYEKQVLEDNFATEIQARLYHMNMNLEFSKKIEELEHNNKDYLIQLEALKPENVLLHKLINKYKQALEEIKEIAKNTCKSCTSECDCIIDGEPCEYYGFYKIKELINEVLNETTKT